MKRLLGLLSLLLIMMSPWLMVMYITYGEGNEVTVERSPKLYCQYGAGYGKRVWEFEPIGNNDIITDADDVFSMSVCEDWSEHGKR